MQHELLMLDDGASDNDAPDVVTPSADTGDIAHATPPGRIRPINAMPPASSPLVVMPLFMPASITEQPRASASLAEEFPKSARSHFVFTPDARRSHPVPPSLQSRASIARRELALPSPSPSHNGLASSWPAKHCNLAVGTPLQDAAVMSSPSLGMGLFAHFSTVTTPVAVAAANESQLAKELQTHPTPRRVGDEVAAHARHGRMPSLLMSSTPLPPTPLPMASLWNVPHVPPTVSEVDEAQILPSLMQMTQPQPHTPPSGLYTGGWALADVHDSYFMSRTPVGSGNLAASLAAVGAVPEHAEEVPLAGVRSAHLMPGVPLTQSGLSGCLDDIAGLGCDVGCGHGGAPPPAHHHRMSRKRAVADLTQLDTPSNDAQHWGLLANLSVSMDTEWGPILAKDPPGHQHTRPRLVIDDLPVVGGSQRTSSVDHSVESFCFDRSRSPFDRPGESPTGEKTIDDIDRWANRMARWANRANAGNKADSAARWANRANAGKTAGSVARRANRANTGKKHPADDHNTTHWN